jgi:hypothetical protein
MYTDEYGVRRQLVEFQELVAGRQILLARDGKFHGLCARGDDHVFALKQVSPHVDGGRSNELRAAMERGDASL